MYATCLFCNSSLGANEAIEHFPVGRRLAYDAATGRLWVVCQACARWNLSPLETRWEAIEEAERLFRATKLRASSDNIGLARSREGTELVRIGKPLKTEFAAWRYGDQFMKRYKKQMIGAVGPSALSAGGVISALVAGPLLGMSGGLFRIGLGSALAFHATMTASGLVNAWKVRRNVCATVRDADGRLLRLTHANTCEATLVPTGQLRDWKLKVTRNRVSRSGPIARRFGVAERVHDSDDRVSLKGDVARRALAAILPHVNRDGTSKNGIEHALAAIDDAPNPEHLLHQAATCLRGYQKEFHLDGGESVLAYVPSRLRFALEMSLHSDDERRAMDGELKELEQRWSDAEVIAKISDDMF